MTLQPKVSIIIAAFNADKYIEQTLNSVISQTYQNLEIIVVNDGSTDGTDKILEEYSKKGIKVFTQNNLGQNAALNFGYQQTSGSFVKFMDADDLINEKCIEIQVETLKNNLEFIAYGEWARFFNNDLEGATFEPKSYWKDMDPISFLTSDDAGPMLQCGIMLVPRDIVNQAGLWNEKLLLSNDTELFTRILLKSKGIKFSKGARLYYRSGIIASLTNQKKRNFFEATYLGFGLIANHLLPIEDSLRTRRFIANLYQMRLYEMYPLYKDLGQMYKNEIRKHGGSDLLYKSGRIFNLIRKLFGWKSALVIKNFIYKVGYQPSKMKTI